MTNTALDNTAYLLAIRACDLKADIRRMAVWTKRNVTPGKSHIWCGIRFIYVERDGFVHMMPVDGDLDQKIGVGMTAYLVSGGCVKTPAKNRREMVEFIRKFPGAPLPK